MCVDNSSFCSRRCERENDRVSRRWKSPLVARRCPALARPAGEREELSKVADTTADGFSRSIPDFPIVRAKPRKIVNRRGSSQLANERILFSAEVSTRRVAPMSRRANRDEPASFLHDISSGFFHRRIVSTTDEDNSVSINRHGWQEESLIKAPL